MRRPRVVSKCCGLSVAAGLLFSIFSASAAADPLPVTWSPAGLVQGALNPDSAPGANDFSCKPAPGDRPIVLTHGNAGTLGMNFQTLAPLLKNNGFCVFGLTYGRVVGLPPGGLEDQRESSAELAAFVDRVLRATGADKVDLVGHSEGTSMPRWWMQFRGGAGKVDRFVGLATQWQGTQQAGLGALMATLRGLGLEDDAQALASPLCGSCLQFVHGSDYLTTLNEAGPTVPGVRYTNIVTQQDELVVPYTSGILERPGVENITLQDVCPQDASEHVALVYSPNVAQIVLNTLAPDRARPVRCVPMLVTGPLGAVPDIGLEPRRATSSAKVPAACVSRRTFTIRIRPTMRPIRAAVVTVAGRRVEPRRVSGTRTTGGRRVVAPAARALRHQASWARSAASVSDRVRTPCPRAGRARGAAAPRAPGHTTRRRNARDVGR